MIVDNLCDIACICLWSIAGGMLIGAHWMRCEWIRGVPEAETDQI